MAKSTSLNVTQEITNSAVTILPADTTSFKTLHTAGTNDDVVKSVMVTSTDSAAKIVQLAYNNGSADFVIGTVPVPAGSGTDGTNAAIDMLSGTYLPGLPLDQNGKRVLPLANGYILKARVIATLTAAKQIDVTTVVEQY